MALFEVLDLFRENADKKPRFLVNQGGTSSGKTYTIMQLLIVLSLNHPRAIITVVGQDLPNLKVGALRDMQTILNGNKWLKGTFRENRSDHYFRASNGSIIEFKTYGDAQDAKNGKRDWLFINEANGVPYDIFWQLQIRTREQVFIDYNPTARFWVHDQIIGRADCKLILSDHRANKFLTKEQHQRIEEIEDKELWAVYARGLTGKLTGLVFRDWGIVDSLPPREDWKMSCRGLDFGFTNDPSALEHVVLAHGELWVDEEIYEVGMTNPDIARRCKQKGVTKGDMIVADCAEPKSIQEIHNEGLYIVPSTKGADSINNGIDILKRYHINVTRRSKGIIGNMQSYKWIVDRDGKTTNKPIDAFNHGIDAIRYVALKKFTIEHKGTARAKIMRT